MAVLDALRDAIFLPSPPSTRAGGAAAADPPDGTPLLRITFATDKGDEVLEIRADGRRVDRTPARGEQIQDLDADRMAAIRHALAAERLGGAADAALLSAEAPGSSRTRGSWSATSDGGAPATAVAHLLQPSA